MDEYIISESNLMQALPKTLQDDDNMRVLGQVAAKKLADIQAQIRLLRIYASIDTLPEDALDLLAVELRTQSYDTSFEINTKRTLIKNTLLWYKRAGTLAAVRELAESLFGRCEIEEWFEYGGTPGCFRVKSAELLDVTTQMGAFLAAVQRVKRLSAHLENVAIDSEFDLTAYIGHALQIAEQVDFTMDTWSAEDFASYFVDSVGDIYASESGDIYVRG